MVLGLGSLSDASRLMILPCLRVCARPHSGWGVVAASQGDTHTCLAVAGSSQWLMSHVALRSHESCARI